MKFWHKLAIGILIILSCIFLLVRHLEKKIPILLYHSILPAEVNDNPDNLSIITPEVFEEQIAYLHSAGFTSITTEELSNFIYNKKRFNEKKVMITFDDGYLDNYVYAYDILKKYNFTAVEFLIGRTIEAEPKPFVPLDFPRFSLQDIEKSADVFEFGSHTFDLHSKDEDETPFLFIKTKEEIKEDFERSFAVSGSKRIMAYPFGKYNKDTVEVLKELECPLGFTVNHGYLTWRSKPYEIPRYSIHSTMTIDDIKEIVDKAR